MKKIALSLMLLALTSCLNAQDRNAISASFINGTRVINEGGTYKGVALSYQINTVNNRAEWTRILNVKNINVEATFYDMNNIVGGDNMTAYDSKLKNKDYFGSNIALSAGIDIGVFDNNAFKVMVSPGIGVMYATKTYFNTEGVNQVLGCHLNAMVSAKLKLLVPVTYNTCIQLSTGITHASNSNTNSLNVGLNRIESSIGLSQYLDYPQTNSPKLNLDQNALSVEMIAGYTTQVTTGFYQLKGVNLQLDRSYRKSTTPIAKAAVSIGYCHYLNEVFGFKAGTDLVYSAKTSPLGSATSDTTKFIETFQGKYTPVYHNLNIGLTAGFDLCLGRVVFSGTYGYYLGGYESYNYSNGNDKFSYGREFYLTFAGRYFLTPNIALEAKAFLYNFGGVGINASF